MAFPLLFGIAQAGAGALSAFGNYQSQVAETNYANSQSDLQYQAAMQQYNYDNAQKVRQWNQDLAIRKMRTQQYQEQVAENNTAYGEYLFQNQVKFNETVYQAMGDKLQSQLALMKSNAANDARGRTGKRSGLANVENNIAFAMENAKRAQDLSSAEYFADYDAKQTRRKVNMDNRNAYYQSGVGIQMMAPTFGPAPMHSGYRSAPNQFGLYSGLLGAATSGYSTYKSLIPTPGK